MRLICPNCSAEYDVADDVIPQGGRDVQCSSCTKTWFQTDKAVVPPPETPSGLLTPAPKSEGKSVEAGAPTDAATSERKPLDSAVADILRQEAARDGKGPAATTKEEPAPARTEKVDADQTRQRIASMTQQEGGTPSGADGAVAAEAAGAAANLRTVPDINEINAALRARAEANDTSGLTANEKEEAQHRQGFRRGFFWVLILIAILILPYVFAEQITENLPQTQPIMASYVLTVDQLRVWLEVQVGNIQDMIAGFTSG
ncbi:zinc-ribbon domain-containing protein [Loktanella sp. Alg231-35]|uniref:zinc-ribbon domain-containing protein n=1 Tax=Loktanella sp. Alg231-35 TaxID=1922220 RepID=UPI001F2838A2|nr:zinc-ribbon domain-containing protein [Loktanella sp. Alg231-35]